MIYWLEASHLHKEWFKCLYMLVTRFLACFLLNYWLCMESLSFYISTLIISVSLTEKMLLLNGPPKLKAKSYSDLFTIKSQADPLF